MPASVARLLLLALIAFASVGASANPAHDKMTKLPEGGRNEAFTEHMSQIGEPCKVERSFFQGFTEEKAAVWSVACANKRSYAIMLNNDTMGTSMLVECEKLKAGSKGARECFKKY